MPEPYAHPFPPELIKHVTSISGDRGVKWLDRLPHLIAAVAERWGVVIGAPFEKGEFNFVAPAASETIDAVLKLAPPYQQTEIFAEGEFLRARDGAACVRLLAEDREAHAILMERARPGEPMDIHFDADPFACVEPAIEVLKSILRQPTHTKDVQFLDDWFGKFRRFRETEFPQAYGERALAAYQRLGRQTNRIHYIHGDFHPGNIVASGRGPFLAIDAKGLIGHVAYDLAVFLNNLLWWQRGKPGVEAELNKALRKFAVAFDLDESVVREAAYAYAVIGAWWSFEDMPDHQHEWVALADVWDI